MSTRRPAVAGTFYPSDRDELRGSIDRAMADAAPLPSHAAPLKALIVPHAGYIYSGAIAASAFRRVASTRRQYRRVVVLGPSHRVFVRGMAVPSVDSFNTPLGSVSIDSELRTAVLAVPAVVADDEPHRHEHSLEVQLPFLQTVLERFTLLPLAIGDASSEEVAVVLDAVWGGPETLIVISTDLSHYHHYDEAVRLDARTAAAIVAADADAIGDRDACGSRSLRGLLHVAVARGLAVEEIDRRNSGDTAGDRLEVVGYGAFAVG